MTAQGPDLSIRSTKESFPRWLGQRARVCVCVYKGTVGFKFRNVGEAIIEWEGDSRDRGAKCGQTQWAVTLESRGLGIVVCKADMHPNKETHRETETQAEM